MVKAAADAGATVINYAKAETAIMSGNRVTGITVRDLTAPDASTFPVTADMVINAAGPWEPEWLAGLGKSVNFKNVTPGIGYEHHRQELADTKPCGRTPGERQQPPVLLCSLGGARP
jgi:glycine/D-amino acid oxidase-like deaminating enzyme